MVTKEFQQLDAEHAVVVLTYDGLEWTESKRVQFWTGPAIPVVEMIQTSQRQKTGSPPFLGEYTVKALEFVSCPGGHVPKRIVTYSSTSTNRQSSVVEFASSDLGGRPPADADFELTAAPQVIVQGLKAPPPRGVVRTMSLSDYSLDDLGRGAQPPAVARPASRWKVPLVFGMSFLLGSCAYVLWRLRPRTAQ